MDIRQPGSGITLGELSARFGGEVVGDADFRVRQINSLHNAQPDEISFLSKGKYRAQLSQSRAGAVIVGEPDRDATDRPRIVCRNPYVYFAQVSQLLNPAKVYPAGIAKDATVAVSAAVAADAHVGARAVVGERASVGAKTAILAGAVIGDDVTLGAGCVIHPNAVIYDGCVLGDRVVVHGGAVIGADGFGLAMIDGRWSKIPQIGRVVIGDDVEIGANTTIDRGALDDTVIEDGVKLDNQIQVAHNVVIGAHTAIAGCVGIAGSAKIGRYCTIGGSAGILGHLEIADHVNVSSFTLVSRSIRQPGTYTGVYPFAAHEEWLKNAPRLRHLDKMHDRVRDIEKHMPGVLGMLADYQDLSVRLEKEGPEIDAMLAQANAALDGLREDDDTAGPAQ